MNVKTLKRMSKRSVSVLLTVLMIISLFTVCMVGTTVTAGAETNDIADRTITLKVNGWQNAHVFVGKGDYTSHYTMSGSNGKFTVTFPGDHHWNDDNTYYFFSETNYNSMGDGVTDNVNISDVYNSLKDNSNCSNLINKAEKDIEDGNVYTVNADGTFTVSSSSSSASSGWINATMYNYRTANQIAEAKKTEGTLTEEQNYTVDSTNGQATRIYAQEVYKQYNDAVADWFQNQSTNGKVKDVSVTPLYQGNIRAGNDLKDDKGTLDWAKSYFNFVSVANGANRQNGAKLENKSIQSVAQGLVDSTLSKNGTIQQNGIELPQFSDAFMNFNADSKIQSKYENLKFEAKVTESAAGNAWYKYDSATDKNRSLDLANRQIKNFNNEVKGCQNENGDQNAKAGYYPFNESQPDSADNITNCFGTRFDIDYAMLDKTGKVHGEDMQFKFTGDDDMWVYIDGHLVLDLGGSHAMASGSINLATMKVSYTSGVYNGTYDRVEDKNSASVAYTSTETTKDIPNDVQEILKDTTRTHKMTIFYMERGLFDSNLSFEFLLPQTNSLTVEQKIDTSNVNSALVKDTLQTADKDVFQTIIRTNSDPAESNNTASVTEDFTRKDVYGNTQVLQKASSSAEQTGTPFTRSMQAGAFDSIGDTNFVWEDKNSTDTTKGKGTPTYGGAVELLYNQSATFNDQFTNGSKFRLTYPDALKSFDLPNLTENQPTSSENGRSRIAYYDTKIKVTDNSGSELIPHNRAYNFGDSSDNIVKVKAEFTDKVKVGSVAFKKNIENADQSTTNEYFTFKIQMRNIFGGTSDSEWKVYEGLKYTVSSDPDTQVLGSNGTVELQHGETLTIAGVPVGTEYRITEIGSSSGTYSVSSVVCDGDVANNSKMVNETNGFNAKLPTSGAGQTASYTVNNTNQKVTVLYRYQDRAVETGLPTDLENHYTYFTRSIAGDISNIVDANDKLTPAGKEKLKASLPEVSNVLMSYSVKEDIQGNVEYTALTNEYLNTELPRLTDKDNAPTHEAEGVPADIKALVGTGKKVLVVTYDAKQKNYTVNLTFPQLENDNYVVKTSLVQGHFNSLILTDAGSSAYTAPEKYTDAAGVEHTFKYWAKRVAIEGGASSNKKWVPVSTNYTYNYRITDNMELKAVYDKDEDYTKLDAPEVATDSTITYMPTGKDTGYAAAASERIYDSYSKDNTDRTRVNVIFDAVGSADLDEDISALGYVLIKNEGSYANASEFTEDDIRAALGPDSSTTKIKGHDAQIKYYTVEGRGDFNGTEYDQTGTIWNGRYNAGKVNLTNKNRANIVFDLKNTEASHNYYFTCYTVMKRGNYTYVSKSPAYFNLGEADPNVTPVTPTVDTYNISTSARYTTDGTAYISDTKAGNVSSNGVRFVKEGQKITVSYYPTSYTEGDVQYVSQLESLKIGKQTITSDDFTLRGIDPTKNGSYQFTFSKDTYLGADAAAGATLEIVASFRASTDASYITVTAPTVTNGTVKIGSEYTAQNDTTLSVKKGSWFYVKAVPAESYGFTNWSVKGTSVSANPVRVEVDTDGKLSVNGTEVTMADLTPNFVQLIKVTLTSNPGGTISFSCTYNGKEVAYGTVAENTAKTVVVLPGTTFALTATPKSGYNFTKWSTGLNGSSKPVVETLRFNDGTITAEFETDANYITVTAPTVTNGTVTIGNDYTAQNDVTLAVKKGGSFYVKAAPADGYGFTNWSVNGTSVSTNPVKVDVDTNGNLSVDGKAVTMEQLTPVFVQMINVTLVSGTGGTISYSCDYDKVADGTVAECETKIVKVPVGTKFKLTANPNSGYNFAKWSSGMDGSSKPVVETTRHGDGTITAEFEKVQNKILYLKLGCKEWKAGTQRFFAYLSGKRDAGYEWIPMDKAGDYLYSVEVPSGTNYTKVIFCKMKNDTSEGGWNSNLQYQTDSIYIPAESGKIYTVTNQPDGLSATGGWLAAPDDNSVTVTAPTNVTNCTVTIGTDLSTQNSTTLTVPKGGSFYVKATHNKGWTFKNWTVNNTPVSTDNPVMVSVSDTGALSVNGTIISSTVSSLDNLVPNFDRGTTGLYLKLDHADWQDDSVARYEAYVYDSNGNKYWFPMTKHSDKLYRADVPNTVIEAVKNCNDNIIFLRFNKDDPENSFSKKWNQTKDLKIPTDGKTTFSVNSRDGEGDGARYGGKWVNP